MKVSIYKNSLDTKSTIVEEINAILSGIKSGRWQDLCLKVMKEKDEEKRKKYKKQIPAYTISGTFSQRSSKNLIKHTGLIGIDFDKVQNINNVFDILCKDQYSYSVFKSVSHTGLCAIVKIDGSKHRESFDGLQTYYYENYGLTIDIQCKDVSRLRYVSYDPELYINDKSKVFKEYVKAKEIEEVAFEIPHSDKRFAFVLDQIEKKEIDITYNYRQWLKLGFAIATQYGEYGYEYYDIISKYSPKYNKENCKIQYFNCIRPYTGDKDPVSIKSFYSCAKYHGLEIYTEEEKLQIKAAQLAKDSGMTFDEALHIIENDGVIPDKALVKSVYKAEKKEEKKSTKLDIEAVKMFLRKYQIKKNEITRKYEWRGREMNTEDLNTVYLEAKAQFEKLSNDMFISILFSHFTPMYNPVKDYFEGLKWDCIDRIEPLVKCITSDTGTDIFRFSAVRSWLLGIIESVYTDEPNILQLIFAGKQNTGKSVFFKQLLPEPLKRYMALSQLDAGKDDQILMCEKLIILDDEYSGKSKDDAKLIKRLLSAPYFNLREPYGKQNVTIKRIASLCATSNETQILNDVTGNRRNLVLEITGKFDYDLYNSIDKEQLFAQLVELHKLGFTSQLNDVMIEQIKEFTHGRNSAPNREEEAIDKLFHPPGMHDGYSYYTNTEILAYINDKMKLFINQKMLGMVLTEMGYEKKQKGKTRIQVYKIMKKE